jgi:hypothetical protein
VLHDAKAVFIGGYLLFLSAESASIQFSMVDQEEAFDVLFFS